MYVQKRGNKYRCFERFIINGVPKKLTVTIDRDTPQARRKAAEMLKAKAAAPVTSGMTFSDIVTEYIKEQKMICKDSTVRRNESTLKRIDKKFGAIKADSLTAGFCRTKLLQLGNNPTTFNEYRRRLCSLIRWAYQNDYIQSTACIDKLKRLPDKSERQKAKDKYLEKDELLKVLDLALDFDRDVIEFLALSGLRIGEAIALNNEDVTEEEIRVSKTFDPVTHETTTPKTADSVRVVHVQPELAACILRIRRRSNRNRLVSGSREPYFIANINGNRLSYPAFQYRFRKLCVSAAGKKLSPHALRHTHVALMAEQGVDLEAISRRLGHSDSKITREIYYHVTQKQIEKDNAAFDTFSIFA